MFCPQCGTAADEHYRYCSKCGTELSGVAREVPSKAPVPRNMATHVAVIGWLFMVCGVITGIFGFFMVLLGRILPGIPLDRIPDIQRELGDVPFDVMSIAGLAVIGLGLVTLAIAVGTFMAGYALLQYKPWARVAVIVFGILAMLHFPFGTALGIYAVWVLLSEPGREFYERKAAAAEF